uniref:Serpentine receptor class gamma n=1 Tax=Caenorhabditis japonica TaxID=281687 RepID=A0A8R1HUL9_CAEJA
MSKLEKRQFNSERNLCFATSLISVCFFIAVLVSLYFAWFRQFVDNHAVTEIVYLATYVAIDVLNVGNPIIMLMASQQLREHVFCYKPVEKEATNGVQLFSTRNSISNLNHIFISKHN